MKHYFNKVSLFVANVIIIIIIIIIGIVEEMRSPEAENAMKAVLSLALSAGNS